MWFFIRKTTRLITYWEIFLRYPENFMIIRNSKYSYSKIMFSIIGNFWEKRHMFKSTSFYAKCEQLLIYIEVISAEDISEWIWQNLFKLWSSNRADNIHTGDWRDSCELFLFLKKEIFIIWQFISAFMFQTMKIRILM